MQKETIQTAKTVALAVEHGATELGVPADKVTYTVMQEPTKGFLGIGANDAIVKVIYELSPADKAEDFVKKLLAGMGIEAEMNVTADDEGCTVALKGEGLGLLIGRHGDVLDSVQYLATIAANKGLKDYYRVSVDAEGYREKRRETLRQLAQRMAEKAIKYDRSFALEPMPASERRIIHAEVQTIKGAATYSIGADAERKVIVCPENKLKKNGGKSGQKPAPKAEKAPKPEADTAE